MFDQQLLPAGCNGNLTVLNLLSACVSDQKSAFLPLQEKLCVGSKNDWHLLVLELSRRSLSACKVWGKIELRAPAVGAKIRVFCMSRLVCLRMGDIVQTSIVWRFMGRFWRHFQPFFRRFALSGALHGSHLCRQVEPQFSRNCRQKLRKVQNWRKRLCAPLRIDSWEILRKFHRGSLGRKM